MDRNRQKIEIIHQKFFELFMERLETVSEIWCYKSENNLPFYDPNREQILIHQFDEKLTQLNKEELIPIYNEFVKSIIDLNKKCITINNVKYSEKS